MTAYRMMCSRHMPRVRCWCSLVIIVLSALFPERALLAQVNTSATEPISSQKATGAARNADLRGRPLVLRNRKDGAIEMVQDGAVTKVYPPGTFVYSAPDPASLRRADQRRRELQEQVQADLAQRDKEGAQRAKAAADAAAQKKRADEEKKKEEEQRADLESKAVTILNGMTGVYVKAIPLDVLAQSRPKQEKPVAGTDPAKNDTLYADLEKMAVPIYNKMTGGYVTAVPVEALHPDSGR